MLAGSLRAAWGSTRTTKQFVGEHAALFALGARTFIRAGEQAWGECAKPFDERLVAARELD